MCQDLLQIGNFFHLAIPKNYDRHFCSDNAICEVEAIKRQQSLKTFKNPNPIVLFDLSFFPMMKISYHHEAKISCGWLVRNAIDLTE
jgi:hypothetical protein